MGVFEENIQCPLASAKVFALVTSDRSRSATTNCSFAVFGALKIRPSGAMIAELPTIELPIIGLPTVFIISSPASVMTPVQCRTNDCDSIAYD